MGGGIRAVETIGAVVAPRGPCVGSIMSVDIDLFDGGSSTVVATLADGFTLLSPIPAAYAALGLEAPSMAEAVAFNALGISLTDYSNEAQAIFQEPEVQNQVVPIVQMFEATLGYSPTQSTLASMVGSNLTEQQIATAFVQSQTFANVYNGGAPVDPNSAVTPAIVGNLFEHGLGHLPTAATVAGFDGMTVEQAFVAFTTSQTVTDAVGASVESNIVGIIEGALPHAGVFVFA
jgi:hypothetical protein